MIFLGITKFQILVDPYLVIITIYSGFFMYAEEYKRIFHKYIIFPLFTLFNNFSRYMAKILPIWCKTLSNQSIYNNFLFPYPSLDAIAKRSPGSFG